MWMTARHLSWRRVCPMIEPTAHSHETETWFSFATKIISRDALESVVSLGVLMPCKLSLRSALDCESVLSLSWQWIWRNRSLSLNKMFKLLNAIASKEDWKILKHLICSKKLETPCLLQKTWNIFSAWKNLKHLFYLKKPETPYLFEKTWNTTLDYGKF